MIGAGARRQPTALGLVGQPVAHSLSPRFQQAALDACDIPLRYLAHEVASGALGARLEALGRSGWAGNITVPHKEVVARLCRTRTAAAERVGAVNTVWPDGNGGLVGHNTDLDGLRASLDALLVDVPIARAVVLGAGGAAAAACVAVAERGIGSVDLVARTPARARRLLDRLGLTGGVAVPDSMEADRLLGAAALVINASPVGQGCGDLPVALDRLSPTARLLDLVYRREGTAWIRAAQAAGWVAEDGLRMLVEQGAAAFTCWFGIDAPREAMWRALDLPVPSRDGPRVLP